MFQGKTRSALRLVSEKHRGDILHLDSLISQVGSDSDPLTVRDALLLKHPPGRPASVNSIYKGTSTPPCVHPVIFECIDADMVRRAALRFGGTAGPSGIDALGWRRMCTSVKTASNNLCQSLALLERRLCTQYVDPQGLAPFLSC